MRSTTSGGVGTNGTSGLRAGCAWAKAAAIASSEASIIVAIATA